MQYRVTKKAFHNSEQVSPGRIITTDEKLPEPCSWAELIKQEPTRAPGKKSKPKLKTPEPTVSFDDVQDEGVESL